MRKKKRINPQFLPDDWEHIKNYSELENRSMSDIVREYALRGMSQELMGEKQFAYLQELVHREIEVVLQSLFIKLEKVEEKSCEAAATSMYMLQFFLENIQTGDRVLINQVIQESQKKGFEYVFNDYDEEVED